jgi:hypothetical protein
MWADYDSSLPVRSEKDGLDERLHVKIVDGSSGAVNQAAVDTDKNLHIEVHGNDADDASDVVLKLSELGWANSDGIYEADNNSDPSNNGLIVCTRSAAPSDAEQTFRVTGVQGSTDSNLVWAMDVSIHDGNGDAYSDTNPLPISFGSGANLDVNVDGIYVLSTNPDPDNIGLIVCTRSAAPGDAEQTFRVTGVQGSTDSNLVWAMDVSLHDENGDSYSGTNPLPVVISGGTIGTAVHHWEKETALAKDGTTEAAYQVTALKTLTLTKVFGTGSGKMKLDISTGSSGGTVQTMVLFNSTAFPNVEYEFAETFTVPAGQWVSIIVTNLDNQAQDIYTMIEGEEN